MIQSCDDDLSSLSDQERTFVAWQDWIIWGKLWNYSTLVDVDWCWYCSRLSRWRWHGSLTWLRFLLEVEWHCISSTTCLDDHEITLWHNLGLFFFVCAWIQGEGKGERERASEREREPPLRASPSKLSNKTTHIMRDGSSLFIVYRAILLDCILLISTGLILRWICWLETLLLLVSSSPRNVRCLCMWFTSPPFKWTHHITPFTQTHTHKSYAFYVLLLFPPATPLPHSGDTGEGEEPTEGQLIRESDNTFMIWASGRQNCLGMAVQLDVSV